MSRCSTRNFFLKTLMALVVTTSIVCMYCLTISWWNNKYSYRMRFRLDDPFQEEASSIAPTMSFDVFLYNRVPKTGSTTLANLFYNCGLRNSMNVFLANFSKMAGVLALDDQLNFVQNISKWHNSHSTVVHGHFPYINFNKFGSSVQPIYISVIRHPVERLLSSYYYKRYGDNFDGSKRHSKFKDTESFDQCHERQLSECSCEALWYQIPYFCGNSDLCSEGMSEEALKRAKDTIRNSYLLVGVTEKMEKFVELLEHLMPFHFQGVMNDYQVSGHRKLRKTKHKEKLLEATRRSLENSTAFKMEIDFYNFVVSYFNKQYNRIKERPKREHDFLLKYEKIRLVDDN